MTDAPSTKVSSAGMSAIKVVAAIIAVVGGVLYFLVSIVGSVVVPLALALGMGYGVSAITKIPLPSAVGLALGSIIVAILFYYGRRMLGTLVAIRELMAGEDDVREDDEDDDEDRGR